VFPGGGVDPRDADPSIPWGGGSAEDFAARLGTDTKTARLVVAAAVRELFEETGALLMEPIGAGDLDDARRRVETREQSMADLVVELGGALDVGQLRPWMRWVTPESETRRFDTFFFVAVLPAGVTTASVSSEGDSAGWAPAHQVLEDGQRERCIVLPPTESVLRAIVRAGSAHAVLEAAAARPLAAIVPEITVDERGRYVIRASGEVFVRPRPTP
ncbi:MAG: NUDIX hydrolase, partial [Nocardioides sp.]|uniref:NUDIX hydrolase n=1 Tax=Nocardioides sp. TaxID=35761 RepID=UPI0032665809